LPNGLHNEIERTFQDARRDDQTGSKKMRLQNLLKWPVSQRKPRLNIHRLEAILVDYEDDQGQSLTEPILAACIQHLCRFSKRHNRTAAPKTILSLEGPPGIGKTELMKQLAKELDLPLIKVQLNDPRLMGSASEPGTLFQALTSVAERNAILFLDEADRVLNSNNEEVKNFSLPFLDPDAQSIFDPYSGQPFPIGDYFTALASNHAYTDAALCNRLTIIKMGPVRQNIKARVFMENIQPRLLHSDVAAMNLSWDELSPQARGQIQTLMEQDRDPGYRTITQEVLGILNKERLAKLRLKKMN
jgi:ATP-dependent Lon protease